MSVTKWMGVTVDGMVPRILRSYPTEPSSQKTALTIICPRRVSRRSLTASMVLNLYVLQGLAPRNNPVPITDVIIGCVPFIVALVGLIILLLAFPQFAFWLPEATR